MRVLKVCQIQADAYVAIADPEGAFLVDGERCRLANAMPTVPSPAWRTTMLAGGVNVRWYVGTRELYPSGEIVLADYSGGKDTAAVAELQATLVQKGA
jgi:hypothetical protein